VTVSPVWLKMVMVMNLKSCFRQGLNRPFHKKVMHLPRITVMHLKRRVTQRMRGVFIVKVMHLS